MTLFTIGFAKKSAREFFELLREHRVNTVIDVRAKANSQLSGFAKKTHLPYLLEEILDVSYVHDKTLAPTMEMLGKYRKDDDWDGYADRFNALMKERKVEERDPRTLDGACLLCSEHEPKKCHRRLVAGYLQRFFDLDVVHL